VGPRCRAAIAIAGTTLALGVVERMTGAEFRLWSRRIVFAVGAVYVARGLWLVGA